MKEQNGNIIVGENDIKEEDIEVLNLLLKQLSPGALQVDLVRVNEVMQYGTIITLRNASKNNILIGIGTLVPIKKLFAFCGNIEDVIVDDLYRGQGLGKMLMETLLVKAKFMGMKFVDLTSSPDRERGNKCYQSIGFKRRETNLYRYFLK